jgi:hypothetical protein
MTAECYFYDKDGSPELTWITTRNGNRVGYEEPHYHEPDERFTPGGTVNFHCRYGLFKEYVVVDTEIIKTQGNYERLLVLFQATGEFRYANELR